MADWRVVVVADDPVVARLHCRADGMPVEAIVVTAATANDDGPCRGAVRRPGLPREAVGRAAPSQVHAAVQRRMAMVGGAQLTKGQVDELCSNGPNALRWFPRDALELAAGRCPLGPRTEARHAGAAGSAQLKG